MYIFRFIFFIFFHEALYTHNFHFIDEIFRQHITQYELTVDVVLKDVLY